MAGCSARPDCAVESTVSRLVSLGRVGWVRGRRRESIPGGLAAACMRRTLPRTQPARPLTVSGGRPPRKKERRANAGRALRLLTVEQARLYEAMHDQRPRSRRRRGARPKKKDAAKAASFFFSISSSETQCSCPPSPGNCRRWDGGGWQDRRRHEWRLRAYRDVLAACPASRPRPATSSATQSRFGFQPTNSRLYQAAVQARRRRTTARQRGASTSSPIGQLTPVPPMPQ